MSPKDAELRQMSNQLNEHIVAVKGTLELVDTSVGEDDLHELLLKAIERMDLIQRQCGQLFAALKNCLDKLDSGS